MSQSLSRTRIKICGMTQPDEVSAAVEMGVDAIGMIMHADSPRLIDIQQAQKIRAIVPALVSLVGVFVDCPADKINVIAEQAGLDLLQLHGDETNEFGLSLKRPFIKAIRAKTATQVKSDVAGFKDARAILLDPYVKGQYGGTGRQLDTSVWPASAQQKVILAGGLSSANVAELTSELNPFAVDFNSGVEIEPGRKSISLMAEAIRAVRQL